MYTTIHDQNFNKIINDTSYVTSDGFFSSRSSSWSTTFLSDFICNQIPVLETVFFLSNKWVHIKGERFVSYKML